MMPGSMEDSKKGEREYYRRLGPEGLRHGLGKPYSDHDCNIHLAYLTAIFQLLPPPPARLVEFGCGPGWLCLLLARRGYDVQGVDIAPDAIEAARRAAADAGVGRLTYDVADYEAFATTVPADAAIFYHALHHAEDPALALRCAAQSLKPGGMLIAVEPGYGHHATAQSQEVISRYGVHENDMPGRRIVALGRAAGFSRDLRLPCPWSAMRQLYRPGYSRADSSRELRGKFLLGVGRLLRHVIRHRRQERELVVLWK